jgi:hypothetical protein
LPTYEFYVDDDRYAVPTLRLMLANDDTQAVDVAQGLLDESGHHRGVEVCLDGLRLTGLGTFATRRLPPERRARRDTDDQAS